MLGAGEPGAFGGWLAKAAGLPLDDHPLGAKGLPLGCRREGALRALEEGTGLLRVNLLAQITEETK